MFPNQSDSGLSSATESVGASADAKQTSGLVDSTTTQAIRNLLEDLKTMKLGSPESIDLLRFLREVREEIDTILLLNRIKVLGGIKRKP